MHHVATQRFVRRLAAFALGACASASLAAAAPTAQQAPAGAQETPATTKDAAEPLAVDPAVDAQLRRFFSSLTGVLSDAIERLDREPTLPKGSWNPFEETLASNADRLNALLDESANLLAEGEATDIRAKLRALDAEKRALDEEIRVGFEKQTAAKPASEREWYQLFGRSKEDWEARIAEAKARRDAIGGEERELRRAFAERMAALGLELGPNGHETLLATVAGDRFVDMVVAFDNVRLVTEQLRRITERMQESPETARRYYGMYVLLVRIMDRVQDAFVEHIESTAIPTVARFGEEAKRTETDARELLRSADAATRELLERNIAACRLAQDAVGNYTAYLEAQAKRVRLLNKAVEQRMKVADNTYRTMSLSTGIAELIRQGQTDLQAVLSMELPELRGFDNAALREQYELLNAQLAPRD